MRSTILNDNTSANDAGLLQNEETGSTRYYTGIDWPALLFNLLENIHWILLTALLCAVATGFYVSRYVTPIYQATSKIYIAGSETTISLSDIQLGSSLATDYQEAFKIWHVHEMVNEELGLNYSYSELSKMVSVYSPSGSHILYINVQSADPEEARLLADTYAHIIPDFIAEKMELRRPQLIQVAQLPSVPVTPNLKGDILEALLIGGFLAAAVVVLLYLLDDRIRTSEDIERATGLATFGILMKQGSGIPVPAPANQEAPPSGAHRAVIRKDLSLGYIGDEAINTICSAIMFTGRSMKRIAITSHGANNGKTFIATRIAKGMADRGEKTLLIDGDLRKASITRQYRIKNTEKGLAHLLSGQCALKDAVYATNIPNLYLLPAGQAIKTPLSLLTSSDFEQLMDYVGKEFDLVIVDTPPVGAVIDAAEIAKRCDGSLVVLEYNRQTKGMLRYVQRIMEQTRTPIIGCVLNMVVAKKLSQRRYYYRYGDNYRYYSYSYSFTEGGNKPKGRGKKK